MSPLVFSGSGHDGGCIFVPTPGIPTPPLMHVDPTMLASSQTPHEEVVQIEQIPTEAIEPVEGLRRSRHPHATRIDSTLSHLHLVEMGQYTSPLKVFGRFTHTIAHTRSTLVGDEFVRSESGGKRTLSLYRRDGCNWGSCPILEQLDLWA